MRLVLFEPEIPQNAGAMLRLAAGFGVGVDVIEPCGFVWSDRRLKRAGMDYLAQVAIERHTGWAAYRQRPREAGARLVLLDPAAPALYRAFAFRPADSLLVGRESDGVPEAVRAAADAAVRIPMRPGLRSFNVAMAAAIVLAEALAQTRGLPA